MGKCVPLSSPCGMGALTGRFSNYIALASFYHVLKPSGGGYHVTSGCFKPKMRPPPFPGRSH